MFTRLLKHQLKSTWKEFNIAYGVIILASILFSIIMKTNNSLVATIVGTIFVFSILAAMFLIVYYSIKLFTSMYAKEAYLNFTLPVSSHSMVISKILAVMLYSLGFLISVILAVVIMFLLVDPRIFVSLIEEFGVLAGIFIGKNPFILIISLLNSAISMMAGLVIFQLILALFNSVYSLNRKKWVLFLLIWAVFIIIDIILQLDPMKLYLVYDGNYVLSFVRVNDPYDLFMNGQATIFSLWSLIFTIIELVGGYFLTIYLIDKKVEIK